jgi:hypothetical protein
MRSLWGKIGIGAVCVFVSGMLLITLVRDAKSAASSALMSALGTGVARVARAAAPHDLPFRLAGVQLGSIRRLAIVREGRGEIPEVTLDVELSDARSLADLADCDLVPEGRQDFDFDRGFRCEAAGAGDYLSVGTATFSPGGVTRPVKVPQRLEPELRNGDPFQATAEMGGDVRVTAKGEKGELVQVHAESSGASIKVNDAVGRALVRLLADSNGASLRVRGKHGRDVVRMEAGEGGFSLMVDTSAAD